MPLRIVVVGGVAGGATAAAKARRENENAEIQIFERGPYVSFANCGLPYYLGGEITDPQELLLMTPEKFWDKYRIAAHVEHEVLAIDRSQKSLKVRNSKGDIQHVPYDKLILSQGAAPIVPPFAGTELPHVFTLRNIPDMLRIDSFIREQQPREAVVIGGGFIGLEMAEAFVQRGLNVTVVEKAPHILPQLDTELACEIEASLNNSERPHHLRLLTGVGASAFKPDRIELDNGELLPADLILVSIGVRPEIVLAQQAGLDIGPTGGVVANGRMESSDPDIYVVGDAAEITHYLTGQRVRIPLAGPANRQGRVAGANAAGGHLTYRGTLGTSIVRVLDQTVACTGLNTAQAQRAGRSFFSSMTRNLSHAEYYPGSESLTLKILVENGSGKLLGAQVMGRTGVDKRIDVLATAIYAGLRAEDLEHLDLDYAPPFNAANDPVNIAGFVAQHELKGEVRTHDPAEPLPGNALLVDVREPCELEAGMLKGAENLPLSQLRSQLQGLPRNRPLVIYCQKGQRGYLATRILQQQGFQQVSNLKGGFLQALYHKVLPLKA